MAKHLVSILLALSLTGTSAFSAPETDDSPYNDASPESLPTRHVRLKAKPSEGLEFALDVWVPAASEPVPVVFFETGLTGLAPAPAYAETMAKIAARGMVAVIPFVDFKAASNSKALGKRFVKTFEWLKDHLEEALVAELTRSVAPAVNSREIIIAGHSSAAKAVMELYRNVKGELAGLMLIDPVNGDPLNLTLPAIPKDEIYDDNVPVLLLATGLGKEPGRKGWPACATDDQSTPYFYDHFAAQKWYVQAADYGHADMLEGIYLKALRATKFCKVAETMDPVKFRTFIAGALAAFVRTVTHKDESMSRYLTDEQLIPVKTILKNEP
ncbi:MAG: hypothetical protein FJ146_15895 [Deltaproteobacteria bacterium]|nr:hypothetical protein [Deltaproteobacteria bacterium]